MRGLFDSDEPRQGVDEDEDAFCHRLLAWAMRELPKKDKRISELLVENTRLQRDLEEKAELLEAYRKVQEATPDRLRIYEAGDTVYVGPDRIEAKVLLVEIGQGRQVRYFVGWWKDGYNTVTLPESEVEGDTPLARS